MKQSPTKTVYDWVFNNLKRAPGHRLLLHTVWCRFFDSLFDDEQENWTQEKFVAYLKLLLPVGLAGRSDLVCVGNAVFNVCPADAREYESVGGRLLFGDDIDVDQDEAEAALQRFEDEPEPEDGGPEIELPEFNELDELSLLRWMIVKRLNECDDAFDIVESAENLRVLFKCMERLAELQAV